MTRSNIAAVLMGALSFAGSLSAQPTVGGLLNNYSYIRPGLPNYGIAQGSIFDIFGTNMAAATVAQSVPPLQTTLGGTTVNVSVGGVTTHPIPYYVSAGQIGAILPSKTPVGTGTITVTSAGLTSAPAPIVVVESAFGLLTVTASGSGAAAAYDYTEGNKLLTQSNAANPGEYLVLWGSGLGPVTGDETEYQTPANLTNIPIEVDIGGVSATVAYHGRSAFPGVDQINVVVPQGVTGCSVSIVVTAGTLPSNYATVPIAATGRTCSDPDLNPISPAQWETLSGLSDVNLGLISLAKITSTTAGISLGGTTIGGGTTTEDNAGAFFLHYTATQLISSGFAQQASIGSCVVSTFSGSSASTTGLITSSPLNAGAQINLIGPDGTLVLSPTEGFYTEPFTTTQPTIIPSTGGTFQFNNGTGGPDVGAFTTSLSASLTTPLVWTNMSAIPSVTRASGVQVTWTGGIPGSFVTISGASFTASGTSNDQLEAVFTCSAPVAAGQFTVPASVLLSLPASGSLDGISFPGSLDLENGITQQFTAPGLDLGILAFTVENSIEVPYQ